MSVSRRRPTRNDQLPQATPRLFGLIYWLPRPQSWPLVTRPASPTGQDSKRLAAAGYAQALKILSDRRPGLEALARGLLEYETLSGDEIKARLAGTPPTREGNSKPLPQTASAISRQRLFALQGRRHGGATVGKFVWPWREDFETKKRRAVKLDLIRVGFSAIRDLQPATRRSYIVSWPFYCDAIDPRRQIPDHIIETCSGTISNRYSPGESTPRLRRDCSTTILKLI
jgi:hypothetical protein